MNPKEGIYGGSEWSEKSPTVASLVARIAPKLGIAVHLEPNWGRVGQLVTPDGRKFYFKGTNFDLNTLGAAEIARDKDYASHFMQDLGYPVPEGRAFYCGEVCRRIGSDLNRDAAFSYASKLGFPVVVKPNSRSQGLGVQKVFGREDFFLAVDAVFNEIEDRVVLVQKPVVGEDYRILVLDDEMIAAYRRTPLSVIGDGSSTIFGLLVKKQKQFDACGRDTRIKIGDYRIPAKLRSENLDLSSIPHTGQKVILLDNANLSNGGEAVDVTDILDDSFKTMAIRLTADMGLRFCGVDVMTGDEIYRPLHDYTVLEINAAPGVDYYAQMGIKQQNVIEGLYEKILLALVRNPEK